MKKAIAGGIALVGLGVATATGAPALHDHEWKAEVVPAAKFKKVVALNRQHRREAKRWKRTATKGPDFRVSLQLAAIAYGQSWTHLRRCALSEGYGVSRRFHRHNNVSNRQGSGAFSSFQFMRGTFLSTPFANLDWSRQDVQAHAAAWMWSRGRRGEWAGAGC